MILAAIMFLAK